MCSIVLYHTANIYMEGKSWHVSDPGSVSYVFNLFNESLPFFRMPGFFIISGFFEMVHVFSVHGGKNRLVLFFGGLFGLIGGGIVLARPLLGLATLTLVLAIYFVVDGIMRIVGAFKLRPASGWGWLLCNGLITFALGWMIWKRWPLSGLWAVGTLVGVRILMTGFGMLFLRPAVNAVVKESCSEGETA